MSAARLQRRTRRGCSALLVIALLTPTSTVAQAPAPIGQLQRWVVHLAADEQTLWLAQVEPQRSQVYQRGPAEPFRPLQSLNAPIAAMAVSGQTLYVFVEEGAFYSAGPDGWLRRHDLPQRVLPADLTADEHSVLALMASPPPDRMPLLISNDQPATTRPFDPADAPLSVARYTPQGWVALAACPASLLTQAPVQPRVGIMHGTVCLFRPSVDGRSIECLRLDAQTGNWQPAGATPQLDHLNRFWVTTVSRVPTIIAATRTAAGEEELIAFRLLGRLEETDQWRETVLHLSELPSGVRAERYEAAFGFNQHVVLLMVDPLARPYIRFGRIDAPPTEVTVAAAEVFERRGTGPELLGWIRGATLLLLFVVLLSLFLLRRGAMATPALLPAEWTLALTFQRLIGWLVDLAPVGLMMAAIIGVDWQAGLHELLGWAIGTEATLEKFPRPRTLLWWGASCGGYTIYSLVMELLTGRTVGKMLMRTRLLSQSGTAASRGQIVLRNLLRLAEMMPPLWVLGFLVVLSRNRQRLGDIFARTVVVRRVRRAEAG